MNKQKMNEAKIRGKKMFSLHKRQIKLVTKGVNILFSANVKYAAHSFTNFVVKD